MKSFALALLLSMAAVASDSEPLQQVHAVYILPMRSGMDQYLANKIVRQGIFQVVTDPQKADAVLTDRIGEPFEKKLDDLYPPPKPVKEKKEETKKEETKKDEKDKRDDSASKSEKDSDNDTLGAMAAASAAVVERPSSFGRSRGTYFLVDRKSRAVIWSTYDRARDTAADTLDHKADQIVTRLKRDLKETK